MIPREDSYGWGVSRIPMARDLPEEGSGKIPGQPVADIGRDLPWRLVALSLLLSLLTFTGIILWSPSTAKIPAPPPEQVEVTVKLMEEVPQPPPPNAEEQPVTKPAEPVHPDTPAPEPQPPEPAKIVRFIEKPEKATVPTPPAVEQRVRKPEPEPMPTETVHIPRLSTEATLPEAPKVTERQREEPDQVLAEKSASVVPDRSAEVPEPTAPRQIDERTTQARLPEKTTVDYGTASRPDLPPPAAARQGPERSRSGPELPKRTTAVLGSASGPSLPGPSASRTSRRSSASQPELPTRSESSTSFAAATGAPELSGPTTSSYDRVRKTDTLQAPDGGTRLAALSGSDKATVSLPGSGPREVERPRAAAGTGTIDASYEALDSLGLGELDPSVAMNLGRLQTCRDPGQEIALRSRLAAMLGDAALCRSGGVVFSIRNVATGYSTHVEIFNYENREFTDRCAALHTAIDACRARR